ncbi:hypothetical protein SK128_024062 [Halocaridina rubra]|uniref:PPPDE domain-containing protein n=1 Tax=Halocaridina rubra TaxID=373956 RepID=A0AAN8ZU15_HALRR
MKVNLILLQAFIFSFLDKVWTGRSKVCPQSLGSCIHRPDKTEIWIYIFSTVGPPCWGLVSFHSGIGFTDTNGTSKYWYYGSDGVVGSKLGCSEDPNGIYSYKVLLGHLTKSVAEIQDVIDRLTKKKGIPCSLKNDKYDCFTVSNYQIFTWNCNYFTAWLADELGFWHKYPGTLWAGRGIGKR